VKRALQGQVVAGSSCQLPALTRMGFATARRAILVCGACVLVAAIVLVGTPWKRPAAAADERLCSATGDGGGDTMGSSMLQSHQLVNRREPAHRGLRTSSALASPSLLLLAVADVQRLVPRQELALHELEMSRVFVRSHALDILVVVVMVILLAAFARDVVEKRQEDQTILSEADRDDDFVRRTSPTPTENPSEPASASSFARTSTSEPPFGPTTSVRVVKSSILGHQVEQVVGEAYDYVMVFPPSDTDATHVVPGLEMARGAFRDPSRQSRLTDEELMSCFQPQMTLAAYQAEVQRLMERMFSGRHFGLEVRPFFSSERGAMFLWLRVPQGDCLRQFAARARYHMPLNTSAYMRMGQSVPVDSDGNEVHAYTAYSLDYKFFFQKFSTADRLKLLFSRIDTCINLDALVEQNALHSHFVPHDLVEVSQLRESWANPWKWYRSIPFDVFENQINKYFGEQFVWMFLWQRFYLNALLVPASLGSVVFFRKFLLTDLWQMHVQIAFAVVMSIWATLLNAMYARYESRVRLRWGVHDTTLTVRTRPSYSKELEDTWRVAAAYIVGDIAAILFALLSVSGSHFVQKLRSSAASLDDNQMVVMETGTSMLTALIILVIDWFWEMVSRKIVNLENHKFHDAWLNSWIRRMFFVRIFNNLYPFVYVAFLKHYTSEGCPSTARGCLDELDRDLLSFFALSFFKVFARDAYLGAYGCLRIETGLRGLTKESDYRYLQLQSKLREYDDYLCMDDWTRNVTTFLLLLCFNVVLPVISVFVLLITMIESRVLAHRNCFLLQRPMPFGTPGIGAWQAVLEVIEQIGVFVNVCFIVGSLQPVMHYNLQWKFIIFVAAEHLLLLLKLLIKGKLPGTPRDVTDIGAQNTNFLTRHYPSKVYMSGSDLECDTPLQPSRAVEE